MFSDFTDSIQIYANKSQITALLDDLDNWEELNHQELIFQCGEIINSFFKRKLHVSVFNPDYNVSEIFFKLNKGEVVSFASLLKKLLDNWD